MIALFGLGTVFSVFRFLGRVWSILYFSNESPQDEVFP